MSNRFDNRAEQPAIIAVVGPNGSGKSSAIFETQIDEGLVFINPDDIARNEFSNIRDEDERNRAAWITCNAQRESLVARRISFGFETVGSHVSKVELLQQAKDMGYVVGLLFVATESPEINIKRVVARKAKGGHDVPDDKVRSRYYRTLDLLKDYFDVSDIATVWDNSREASPHNGMRMLVKKSPEDGVRVFPDAFDVEWVQKYLPKVFERNA